MGEPTLHWVTCSFITVALWVNTNTAWTTLSPKNDVPITKLHSQLCFEGSIFSDRLFKNTNNFLVIYLWKKCVFFSSLCFVVRVFVFLQFFFIVYSVLCLSFNFFQICLLFVSALISICSFLCWFIFFLFRPFVYLCPVSHECFCHALSFLFLSRI